jgi:hypothetical protein
LDSDWIHRLQKADCLWHEQRAGATDEEIRDLRTFFGRRLGKDNLTLPPDYVAFLRFANGARITGNEGWYIRVWASYDIPSWATAYDMLSGDYPGIMPIADDGGDQCIAFDTRTVEEVSDFGVYEIPFISTGWKDSKFRAQTFSEYLLQHLRLD